MSVNYIWCGAPTSTSLRPIVVLDAAASVRVAFSTSSSLTNPIWSSTVSSDSLLACRPGNVTGLTPNTRYYYAAEVNGVLDTTNKAQARTLPSTKAPLRITFGSCWAATGQQYHGVENHPVGTAVSNQHDAGANMHLFCGDLGYLDNEINDPNPWADNFPKLHAMSHFKKMARSCAWASIWDDHDFGGNDSNGGFARKELASSTWRALVPMYDLTSSAALYQAFNLTPDVRVVISDLRYFRDSDSVADSASKTMMAPNQKAWLKDQWLAAKNAGQLIIWVTSSMWCIDGVYGTIGTNADGDGWWRFEDERRELDNYRASNGITDMIILTGDGHQISYRNRCDYSDTKTVPVPTYAAAAYSRRPAYREGAWDRTSTPMEGDGHYGVLNINPGPLRGWDVSCDFHRVDVVTGEDRVEFTATAGFKGVASTLKSTGSGNVLVNGNSLIQG